MRNKRWSRRRNTNANCVVGSSAYFRFLSKRLSDPPEAGGHGRRVLRFDNYGRGHSADDGTQHHLSHFVGQFAEILYAIGEVDKVDLVGYSMGGGIVSGFASTYPDRIHSLTLLSPVATTSSIAPSRLVAPPVPLGRFKKARALAEVEKRFRTGQWSHRLLLRVFSFLLHYAPYCVFHRVASMFFPLVFPLSKIVEKQDWNDADQNNYESHLEWERKRLEHETQLPRSAIFSLLHFPMFAEVREMYA